MALEIIVRSSVDSKLSLIRVRCGRVGCGAVGLGPVGLGDAWRGKEGKDFMNTAIIKEMSFEPGTMISLETCERIIGFHRSGNEYQIGRASCRERV